MTDDKSLHWSTEGHCSSTWTHHAAVGDVLGAPEWIVAMFHNPGMPAAVADSQGIVMVTNNDWLARDGATLCTPAEASGLSSQAASTDLPIDRAGELSAALVRVVQDVIRATMPTCEREVPCMDARTYQRHILRVVRFECERLAYALLSLRTPSQSVVAAPAMLDVPWIDGVFGGTIDGLWDWNLATGQLWLSPRLKQALGYGDELDDHIATFGTLLHPGDRERVACHLEDHLGGSTDFTVQFRLRAKQGDFVWWKARGQALWDDQGTAHRMVGSASAIVAQEAADNDIGRAVSENDQLFRSIPAIVIGVSSEGRVFRWNTAAENLFGITSECAVGQLFSQCPIDWHDRDMPLEILEQAANREIKRWEHVRFRGPAGDERLMSLTVTPVIEPSRDSYRLLMLAEDMTEQRRREAQRQHSQKLESIGQLAAGIAHEVNTPIQYIGDNLRFLNSSIEMLWKLVDAQEAALQSLRHGDVATTEGYERLDSARRQFDMDYFRHEVPIAIQQSFEGVQRVAEIVRAMNEFARPDSGQLQLIDVNHCLKSAILVARNEWKYVADVVADLDETIPLFPCVPGDVNQAMLNLIMNAAQAIADRADRAEGEKGTIGVTTRQQGASIEIRISDTGVGIPDAIQSRIFDPFFTTKDVGRGTGQGLPLAYAVIVEKHAGSISFDTYVGRGTTFVVQLPVPANEGGHTA